MPTTGQRLSLLCSLSIPRNTPYSPTFSFKGKSLLNFLNVRLVINHRYQGTWSPFGECFRRIRRCSLLWEVSLGSQVLKFQKTDAILCWFSDSFIWAKLSAPAPAPHLSSCFQDSCPDGNGLFSLWYCLLSNKTLSFYTFPLLWYFIATKKGN